MSTVSRGTSMQASSRSNKAPVNELTFNESERVASGLPAACNWRKLKGVELCSTQGPDPPLHSLPHQENFFPPSMPWRRRPAFLTLFLFRNQALLIPAAGRASFGVRGFHPSSGYWVGRYSSRRLEYCHLFRQQPPAVAHCTPPSLSLLVDSLRCHSRLLRRREYFLGPAVAPPFIAARGLVW